MSLLVPAYPGCPGSKAVKRSLLLLLSANIETCFALTTGNRPKLLQMPSSASTLKQLYTSLSVS